MKASRPRGNVFRMASFRLAVLGTLFSTIGAIVVFALIYGAIFYATKAEFGPIIDSERAELFADMAANHLSLKEAVEQDLQSAPENFYALTDARGNFLAGNIELPPDPLEWQSLNRWNLQTLPAGVSQIDGIGQRLPDGGILFIGENASAFAALDTRIAYVFAGVFGVTIGLGLLVSLLIANYSLRRVSAISDTSRSIVEGDLAGRIKLYGNDDELDFLTNDLNKMIEAMQSMVENVRQVTSDIAHDLRSPLTRLREKLEGASRKASVADIDRHSSEEIFKAALSQIDQILVIFNGLLRIGEIEAGAAQGGFSLVNISALCHHLIDTYEIVAEDNGQTITGQIEDGLWAHADIELLTQMIVNLLENAIRHCPPCTAINVRAVRTDKLLTLSVADDGPGIPEADRERVFKRFVRLDKARQSQGNGLGLALVKAIVVMHRGDIVVGDNQPGLIMRIMLPID